MDIKIKDGHERFELRRQSDDLVYTFIRMQLADGSIGYQRQDQDLWIAFRLKWGWVAWDIASHTCMGRPWQTLPDRQELFPPEGDWVGRKGSKSHVYNLAYV